MQPVANLIVNRDTAASEKRRPDPQLLCFVQISSVFPAFTPATLIVYQGSREHKAQREALYAFKRRARKSLPAAPVNAIISRLHIERRRGHRLATCCVCFRRAVGPAFHNALSRAALKMRH